MVSVGLFWLVGWLVGLPTPPQKNTMEGQI